ncbi:hypothetical protein DF011_17750 [Burkholderia ubonensis]|uniref:SIR2 family protein n=2 Tax=Burkholderia ubonensis TaxID=101571 RepID=UPI000BA7A6B3|nr:SIR2 family protein [Burkholderia ubonensis]PAJ88297.1 hypothetical protein CJO70_07435 [Burkholderia ubonensis]PAJ94827.1 hypothetical protein CJO69_09710 [Burkholderia ubonensis]PAK08682.1 hypothetical protein CJO67_06740 [Burkholderia ubonensis]RQP71184.1 hypothetical protein DF013_22540 [Burkholderia ubonensis]RQP82833.1 hypothetical protein DF014_18670 [Burkholderia ubonensis]
MSCMLLLGAGFSRNWGGWLAAEAFEYLLGCPEVNSNAFLSGLLWRTQQAGGFENALAELQDLVRREPEHADDLESLRGAVLGMFNVMNQCFFGLQNFDQNNNGNLGIRPFLTTFDAIFTLNQDLLLEYHYLTHDVALLANRLGQRRWHGSTIPGMRSVPNPNRHPMQHWFGNWTPAPDDEFQVEAGCQPYIKLHGSSNWTQNDQGGPMLIMGGNKANEIGLVPVLQWYQTLLTEYLTRGDSRLMVIGYGFRDDHINEIISDAVTNHNLKLFVISPDGADQARKIAPTAGAAIQQRTVLEDVFRRGLIGASRRSIHEIFSGRDPIELSKLQRFVEE